jgi:hypothetical protein
MNRFTQAALALSLALALPAMAEVNVNSPADTSRGKPHVGVLLGYGDINGETKGAFNYGVDAGYQICSPWSIGLQINTMKSTEDFLLGSVSNRRWSILPKVAYNFGGDAPILRSSYLGVKFGAVIDHTEATLTTPVVATSSNSITRFGVAPVIGFDEPIFENWTAGIDLSYLFVFGPESNNDSFHALGAIKYWF